MNTSLQLRDKALILVGVPLLLQVVAFGFLFVALNQSEQDLRAEEHAKQINLHLNKLAYSVISAAAHLQLDRTPTPSEHKDFVLAVKAAKSECILLELLLQDTAFAINAMPELIDLKETISNCVVHIDEAARRLKLGQVTMASEEVSTVKFFSATLVARGKSLAILFQKVAERGSENQIHGRRTLQQVLVVLVLADFGLALLLLVGFNRDTTRRLSTLMENTTRFAKGQPLNQPVSGQDEIAHLDSTFHDMAHALDLASEQKQQFMAMIAHDIRTPLTTMSVGLGLLETQLGASADSSAKKVIAGMDQNAQRLLKLICDLLDVEKLEAGKMDVFFDMVPVAHILESSLQSVRHLANLKELKLVIPTTDAEVYADADRLVQVCTNLLSNAIKYSPNHGTITVTVLENADSIELAVQDQGPGVPEDYRDKVFERYQQVATKERQAIGGTGLGLFICREIVELHQGQIGVKSGENTGSVFWFRLPRNGPAST